jgi:hypothetical protein
MLPTGLRTKPLENAHRVHCCTNSLSSRESGSKPVTGYLSRRCRTGGRHRTKNWIGANGWP